MYALDTQSNCCAVILAGGLNSRMGGRNKAFLKVGDRPIVHRLLSDLKPAFEEILLVTRQPERYTGLPVNVVRDIYDARSSLTGIHAGLAQAEAEYAFVVPCDTPFLQPAVINELLNVLTPDLDVIVPLIHGRYEPLCAIYSKRCIPFMEKQLDQKNYRIIDLFDHVRVKSLGDERLQKVDPDLISFFNVNTPAAYETCKSLLQDS